MQATYELAKVIVFVCFEESQAQQFKEMLGLIRSTCTISSTMAGEAMT